MIEIGRVIENLLRKQGLWNKYRGNYLVYKWGILVGEQLAGVSKAREIQNGILKVTVKDATWACHLSLLKPGIIKKLNEELGETVVKDIFFQVGEIEGKE